MDFPERFTVVYAAAIFTVALGVGLYDGEGWRKPLLLASVLAVGVLAFGWAMSWVVAAP